MDQNEEHQISGAIVIYKFILGIGETLLGLGVLVWGRSMVRTYGQFQVGELIEDPHDRVINFLRPIVPFFLNHSHYIIFMLLLLGLTKIIGAIALWRGHDWGLDLIVGLFVILVPFDLVELFYKPNPLKVFYFLINILITFYLVEFKPHKYVKRLYSRLRHKRRAP